LFETILIFYKIFIRFIFERFLKKNYNNLATMRTK